MTKKLSLGHLAPEIKARLNHLRRQSLRNAYLALRILEGRKASASACNSIGGLYD